MKKIFQKSFSLVIIVALVIGTFSFITVQATGANNNSPSVARALSDEGIVLLKNDNNALPLKQGANVAIFGEGQHLRLYTASDFNHDNSMGADTLQKQHGYIPWGAGSSRAMGVGGKNAAIDPLDAFNYAEKMGRINVYDAISQGYIDALENSNSDESFVEYIPTEADYQAAVDAGVDTAVVVISRFDGECVDLPLSEWSLFDSEKSVLQNATKYFDKVIVVLNTPTPIDTSWAFTNDLGIEVDSVLFAGYGGMQGGWAIADVILGDVNPSGKLVTTYAKNLEDYPTTESFINDSSTQKYTEDIFLGYRYFETFDPTYSKVNFEFGFGLSYTTFSISTSDFKVENGVVTVKATVKNTGDVAGKEVVQMYLSAPQGELGKAAKVLCAFDKTQLLQPGESETLTLTCELDDLASFDDLGKTGNKSAYVLEAGDYKFYVGNSVKEAGTRLAGTHNINELKVVEQLTQQAKTNLDKRLLADGTFENLSVEAPSTTPTPAPEENEEKVHNIGNALRIESEDWMEKPYSANPSYTGSTEKFTGVLYNKLTNTWETHKGITFSQGYMIKSVTYKVNAEKAGEYKISVRYASNQNSGIPKISVQTSADNVTFSEENSFTCIKTHLLGGNAYNSYMDADYIAVTLNEGINYIKFNVSSSPNIDSFLICYSAVADAAPIVKGERNIFEAENYYDMVVNNYTKVASFTNGGYFDGSAITTYSGTCVESMFPTGSYVTYKLNVLTPGYYKMTARLASTGTGYYDILLSTDGTNFYSYTNLGDLNFVNTQAESGNTSGYHWYMNQAVEGYFHLRAGVNYIKVLRATSNAPNLDFFAIEDYDLSLPAGGSVTIQAEDYDSNLMANTALKTVEYNQSGKLYNEETGAWDGYTATALANTYASKEVIYTVYVEEAGDYSFSAIAASNDGKTGGINMSSAVDNFATKITASIDDTYTPSGDRYHGFKKITATGTIKLDQGLNTIKVTFNSTAPNVDSFTIFKAEKTDYKQLVDVVSGAITLDAFVEQMTNEELATFFVSYPGLNFGGSDDVNAKYGISRVAVSDGPSGIGSRATSFPCETIIACTWNTDLVEAFGRVMGVELYDNDIEVWLAPGVNLHRNPLSGRNSEYYSEDPFISGVMAVTTIKAVQRYGVSICVKHFCCNEKEANKLAQDVRVSERALREIYLKPFEMAVKDGKAQGIMSSYNLVNGVAMNENKDILTNILRGEWGYQYYISGDWNNNKDMVKEINAGHGVREPYTYCDIDTVITAINEGKIERETLLTGAKYELNTLMRGKRNYSKWTKAICNGNHTFVNDVCSVCHAPDQSVFTNLDSTIYGLVDNMPQNLGLKMTVLESAITTSAGTIKAGHFTNKINALNGDKTKAEITINNTMASRADVKVKLGVYVPDSKWTRVTTDDTQYSYSGDDGIYKSGGWLTIPYGCTATLWLDLSDSKYDTFKGADREYSRSEYANIIYFAAPNAQAGDRLYLKGENISTTTTSVIGTTIENVDTKIAFNNLGEYEVEARLEGDYGTVLDTKLLEDAGLKVTDGKFYDGKVDADYILKATDNEDYVFVGWYDKDNKLVSTEKLVPYNTLEVPKGINTLYAHYIIKDAKVSENTIKGATLNLGESLTLDYYADLDKEHASAILNVTRNGRTESLTGTKDASGMYKFSYKGINPQCMTDNIKAELVYGDEVLSVKEEYSVKAYAENQMSKTAEQIGISGSKYTALKTLLSDMLIYGDNAQMYRNYNIDDLASTGVSWLAPSTFIVPAGVKNVTGNTDENNKVLGLGVNVSNVNKIYFRVKVTDATVYVDGVEMTPDENNKVYTEAIKATQYADVHTIEIVRGNEVLSEIEYNVNAYIQAKHESEEIDSLVKAISNYGVSAKAYVAAN